MREVRVLVYVCLFHVVSPSAKKPKVFIQKKSIRLQNLYIRLYNCGKDAMNLTIPIYPVIAQFCSPLYTGVVFVYTDVGFHLKSGSTNIL